ncbi:hypothetical protein Acr_23g0008280 [Actinidia rufa]|uniref:S-locus receptor kinase C-terminal domain-containing protein n=1 Tax=Actinidia rufa TaxID=165716 RepID=A0A7J0GNT8_9ERIC|nr:hypothetical protein Acr_23g0008280 [Actinidia rufa]
MATVAVMLGGEGSLPRPKQPAFFTESSPVGADSSCSKHEAFSGFESIITEVEGR